MGGGGGKKEWRSWEGGGKVGKGIEEIGKGGRGGKGEDELRSGIGRREEIGGAGKENREGSRELGEKLRGGSIEGA